MKKPGKYDTLNKELGNPYKNGNTLRSTLTRMLKKQKQAQEQTNSKVKIKSEITINANGTQSSTKAIQMTAEQAKNVEFVLKAHGYDPKLWTIVSASNSQWEAQIKGGEIKTLYASKITVKPKKQELNPIDLYKDLLKLGTKHTPTLPTFVNKTTDTYMLEIALQDLHIGKLAWAPETGENYDYKIALSRAKNAIRDILERAKGRNVEKILFLLGGDTYHGDNTQMQTTSGTPLDSDVRWQKMFMLGTQLLVELINEMLTIAPVDVITILGNHSVVTEMHSQMYLKAWYHNDERVNIDTEMTPRKYYEYGKCLIGFTHGDKESKRISGVMQIEQAEAWGRTLFREIHAGHLHSEQTTETNGIIIRNIASVTGTDSWHTQKGFIGAQRKLQAFLWNKDKGLLEIWNSPILAETKNLTKTTVGTNIKKQSNDSFYSSNGKDDREF